MPISGELTQCVEGGVRQLLAAVGDDGAAVVVAQQEGVGELRPLVVHLLAATCGGLHVVTAHTLRTLCEYCYVHSRRVR